MPAVEEEKNFSVPVTGPTIRTCDVKHLAAGAVGLCAIIWFVLLSGWLGVTPGSVITKRQNVLFNSDSNLWVDRMIGNARSPEQLVHPLEILLWRGPSRALYHFFQVFLPSDRAGLFATRLLVAVVAGIGVGFLALFALENDLSSSRFVLLFVIYLLFTTNVTVVLPEHFGISNGLLTISFVVPFVITSTKLRAGLLLVLTTVCGGTTITNALCPLGSLVQFAFKWKRVKMWLIFAAVPVALGLGFFVYTHSYTIHWFVTRYLNLRLLRDPLRASVYTFFAWFGPVVGPLPLVMRFPGWDMVTYEPAHAPMHLSLYSWIQVPGVVAWLVLLARCVSKGLQQDRTRPFVTFALAWILFNAVFHNIWGDDFILYAPHWSWALMALVIMGARDLSKKFIATAFVPIVVAQIDALLAIKSALLTITR